MLKVKKHKKSIARPKKIEKLMCLNYYFPMQHFCFKLRGEKEAAELISWLPNQMFESRGTCIIFTCTAKSLVLLKADTPRELVELSAYEDYSHKRRTAKKNWVDVRLSMAGYRLTCVNQIYLIVRWVFSSSYGEIDCSHPSMF